MSQEGYEGIHCTVTGMGILPEPEEQGVQSMRASEIGNRSLMTLSGVPGDEQACSAPVATAWA